MMRLGLIKSPWRLSAVLAWLTIISGPVAGQFTLPRFGEETKTENPIEARVVMSLDRVSPGTEFLVGVVLEMKPPWHVNAHRVTSKMQIPTTLTWATAEGIEWGVVEYPEGKLVRVEWMQEKISLYEKQVVLMTPARVREDAAAGRLTLTGTLRYQACDDHQCLAPVSVPVKLDVEVSPLGTILIPQHGEVFGERLKAGRMLAAGSATGDGENEIARRLREQGWLAVFLFLFVGGLLLNLTPCVYPMLAITVGYFGSRRDPSRSRAAMRAGVYFLGIVLTYSTVGLVAAMTGGLFGAVLQSKWVLLGVAAVLVGLALSLFGWYELQPPQFLMRGATGLTTKAGYMGVFFLGAMVGIIAAPCIAPVLVALLVYVGQRGDPLLGWTMFMVLACGLGAPYVVLGTFSGLLSKLPRSGMWMVWVKRGMGVVLMVVAAVIARPAWSAWVPESWRGVSESPVDWVAYSPEAVEAAAAAGKPVLLDFRADWCLPCLKMEATTFVDSRVVELAREFVMVKADLTESGSAEAREMLDRYRVKGVPTIVFLDRAGTEAVELRQTKEISASQLIELMRQVKAR